MFKNLKPELVWKYFSDILEIPRPSKKEERIIQYIRNFAESNGLNYKLDKAGNILITKTASNGSERKKTVVLQSHLDMVCEKNQDSPHNFDTDPIQTYIDNGWIKAKGTTLGADNGIGVAIQLAVLVDKNIEHGPLECLFTVDEESGMTGALRLENDFLSGNTLINLDSEDEGEIFIGCAGGIDTVIAFPVEYIPVEKNYRNLTIEVKGLLGGHSGDDINKARGNAIKILARLLWNLAQTVRFNLCTISGGNLRNAIPRESSAIVSYNPDNEREIHALLKQQIDLVSNEFTNEPELIIEFASSNLVDKCLEEIPQRNLLNCLHSCPNGVIEMSREIPDLVETSTNLASIRSSNKNIIEIVTSQRSSVESAKLDIASRIRSTFEIAGATVRHSDSYPGWSPNSNSEILQISEMSYRKLFNTNPKVKAIHAGLECGLFLQKYPDLDMISIGPTIKGAHSPDERMEINTVEKFWEFLMEILRSIPENTR